MVEERQRSICCQRAEPERQTGKLHGGGIEVDSVQASLRNEATEAGPVGGADVAARDVSFADERPLVGISQIPARRYQERATSHRGIEHAQGEHFLRRAAGDERRERAPHEIFRHGARRVERSGRLARPRPREDEGRAATLGPEIQDPLVDSSQLLDPEIGVGDPLAAIAGRPRRDRHKHIANDPIVERARVGQRRRGRREKPPVERRDPQRAGPAAAMREASDRLHRFPQTGLTARVRRGFPLRATRLV